MGKKVAIICYSFPPFPGIGGRRWAKFSYYLVANGYEVHIICAKSPFTALSQWTKDIENIGVHLHYLPLNYPKVLLKDQKTFWNKTNYYLWKVFLSFYSNGTIFERSIFWKKKLNKTVEVLIRSYKISNLIVTIPPFRLAYYTIFLKKKFPSLNLLIDYRDPWTDNKTFHGFKDISLSRLHHEQQMEQDVLNLADHIFTVSDKMTENLKMRSKYPDKVSTLLNGFDPRDISYKNSEFILHKEPIKTRFIYAGTLYSNIDYIIDPLLKYLNKLQSGNQELYNSLSFEFYGTHNNEIANKIKQLKSSIISVHNELPLNEIQQKIGGASFGVLMSAPDHAFAFNTKFYEYLANNKPILLFSFPGETSRFLLNKKLGFHINPTNLENDMNSFFSKSHLIVKEFNNNFDVSPYSIPTLTLELDRWLI